MVMMRMARCILMLLLPCAAPLSTAAFRGSAYPSRRVRPVSMVFPTLGLTVREQARLSAMRCTDEPLIEEMGGAFPCPRRRTRTRPAVGLQSRPRAHTLAQASSSCLGCWAHRSTDPSACCWAPSRSLRVSSCASQSAPPPAPSWPRAGTRGGSAPASPPAASWRDARLAGS